MGNKTFMMMDQPQPSRKRTAEEAFCPTKSEKNRKKEDSQWSEIQEGRKRRRGGGHDG